MVVESVIIGLVGSALSPVVSVVERVVCVLVLALVLDFAGCCASSEKLTIRKRIASSACGVVLIVVRIYGEENRLRITMIAQGRLEKVKDCQEVQGLAKWQYSKVQLPF
jgi:hypothetical protein